MVDYLFIKFGLTGELVMSKIHLKKNEKPQVQLVRPFFFFFWKKKSKIVFFFVNFSKRVKIWKMAIFWTQNQLNEALNIVLFICCSRKQWLPARRAHSRAPRASDATSTRPTRRRFPRVPRKIVFLDSRDQNQILFFFDFFLIIYDQYFRYKPPFPIS